MTNSADVFEADKAEPEVIDYIIDYVDELGLSDPADTLVSSVWTQTDSHADDLTVGADSIDGTTAIVRISSGGRVGVKHRLVNRVTTASAQVHQRTIIITMRK